MNIELTHFHLFCGLGGGALGFNRAEARISTLTATYRCLGGIDSDPAAVRDFGALTGTPGTCLDLFDREQYRAWHGCEPPADWREATPVDLRTAAGTEAPDVVFTSPPCKGFSGLLSERLSTSDRYAALNRLTVRGIWLALEAWQDNPPSFILLENVPRIATRGAAFLDCIQSLLQSYGYASARTTHDCGELGGLSQSRKRFFLVARHTEKIPPHLYEPARRPLRPIGAALGPLPMPGHPAAGPLHTLPALKWRTWVRLALVPPGRDWRALQELRVSAAGTLDDYLIVPQMYRGGYGVLPWDAPAGTVTADARPSKGAYAVADPRLPPSDGRHATKYRIIPWGGQATTVTGADGIATGAQAVADPRLPPSDTRHATQYRIIPWAAPGPTVTGTDSTTGSSAHAIADPRMQIREGNKYGHYGVMPWTAPTGAVTGAAGHDNGSWSIADPRPLPGPDDASAAWIITALDGTWHRPLTTLELAALQGLTDPSDPADPLTLSGASHAGWRERIGNAVPPPAAQAIAGEIARTILLSTAGETFILSDTPVWVRQIPTALALDLRLPPS